MKKIWKFIYDYYWFNFVIKKNEFHPKLDINWGKILQAENWLDIWKAEIRRCQRDRKRAHELDLRWGK